MIFGTETYSEAPYSAEVEAVAEEAPFFENRHPIAFGMKPITAAGMGGVLIE